jgi:hypothetical protein
MELLMNATMIVNPRESDGKFALRLESKRSLQRDAKRTAQRRQRAEELRNDPANAAFLADGIDPSDIFA